MFKSFKTKLSWITLSILLFYSTTCCFANNDAIPISADSKDMSNAVTTSEEIPERTDDIETIYQFLPHDLYKADSNVTISEDIDGNAFVVGNNVTLSGKIAGDFFVCANTLTIEENAIVYGSIFTCSSTMTINGMAYDVYALANEMTIGETAYIERDIKVATSTITLNGMINRDAYLVTNNLRFPDDPQTVIINGNLKYISPYEFEIAEGVVGGNTTFTLQETDEEDFSISAYIVSCINKVLSSVLYSLAILLLVAWLTPSFIQKSGNLMKKKTPIAFGIGLLTFVGTITGAFALLFLTYSLGSAISVAAITLLILTLTISETIFALAGARLFARKIHQEKTFQIILYTLLNVFIINILKLIPLVGSIIGVAVTIIGLGYIMVNLIFKKEDFMTYESNETTTVKEA